MVSAIPADVPVVRIVPVLVSVVRITPDTLFVVYVSPVYLSCGCDTAALRFRGCHATALQFRGCHATGTPNPWCTRHWHSLRGCHATSALTLWCARPGHFVTTDLAPPPPALHPAAAATIRLQFRLRFLRRRWDTAACATICHLRNLRNNPASRAQLFTADGAYLRTSSAAICAKVGPTFADLLAHLLENIRGHLRFHLQFRAQILQPSAVLPSLVPLPLQFCDDLHASQIFPSQLAHLLAARRHLSPSPPRSSSPSRHPLACQSRRLVHPHKQKSN